MLARSCREPARRGPVLASIGAMAGHTRHPADDDALAAPRQRLIDKLLRHARDGEVLNAPACPSLILVRQDQPQQSICGVYEPCVALVVQGRKRVDIGDRTLVYDARSCFVTPLDLPAVATILEASPERPFLSVALRIDMREVAALLLEGALPAAPACPVTASEHRAMATGALTRAAARRLRPPARPARRAGAMPARWRR